MAAIILSGADARASELIDNATEVTEDLHPALLVVTVNGVTAEEPILLLRSPDGTLYAPEQALRAWRMKPWEPAFTHSEIRYYSLSAPGLHLQLIDETQSLIMIAAPGLLEPTRVSSYSLETGVMTPSATGAFLNYDLVGQVVGGQSSLNGLFEAGVFTPFGVGETSFVGHWTEDRVRLTRLGTHWTRDDPDRMRSLRLGDSVTRGGVGGNPVRFAGVQLARNFAVQPGFITIPLPSLQAEAAVPSVVDLYVNNVLTESRDLPPGPFDITSIPVVTGGGEIQLIVRDVLGRETLISESYYTAREILRGGLHDYSYEVGFLRQNFGRASFDYGAPMVSATHRHGLSDHLTGEAHFAVTPEVQTAGVGASLVVTDVGLFNASAAVSNSDRGQGTQIEIGFERRTPRLSYGALTELISEDYVSVGSSYLERRPPAATVQAFAGIPLKFGSLGISYLWRDAREEPDLQLLSANATIRIPRIGSLSLAGRTSLSGPESTAVLLSLVVPLGVRKSASLGAEVGEVTGFTSSFQKSLPAGSGVGYRAAVDIGEVDRLEARISVQTNFGTHHAEVSWVDERTGVRLTTSGGIGVVKGEAFASRKLMQSFATVRVGDYVGVRIYADNQHVATTDESGRAVIPRLRPYERNEVRLELADLPIDADFSNSQQTIRPYNRSGVAVAFEVNPSRGAIISLVRANGMPVPAGASVRLDERSEELVVAPGGEVYATRLELTNSGTARWQGGRCRFRFHYPDTPDPQPRIGPVACQTIGG